MREWGTEVLLSTVSNHFTLKRITMLKGKKGGLQYHHKKDEVGVVLFGIIKITYDENGHLESKTVLAGDVFRFPAGCVHQAEALTDCAYIEASTPYLNDRVHVEKEYGIEEEAGGLPSTAIEEVVGL